MSILNQLIILFCIFLLKSWKLSEAAYIYNPDYHSLDVSDQDIQDYWNNYDRNTKRFTNEPDENYVQKCKPVTYTTTSDLPPTTNLNPTTSRTSESKNTAEADDVIEHIITILRSMRQNAIALMRNMNVLEMDILSSSSPTNMGSLCKNSTINLSESMNGLQKIVYPDVLSQTPGYVISEWSNDPKTESAEALQTNDFVAEAQEAVKSWKQQIENCKRILDNAVHNALLKANIKSDLITDPIVAANINILNDQKQTNYPDKVKTSQLDLRQLSRDVEQEQDKLKTTRSNWKHKYQSIYDALRLKKGD